MSANTMPGWGRLYDMPLGELVELADVDVRRVPGGWIFTETVELPAKTKGGKTHRHSLVPVFIPFCDEFAKTGNDPEPTTRRSRATEEPDENNPGL